MSWLWFLFSLVFAEDRIVSNFILFTFTPMNNSDLTPEQIIQQLNWRYATKKKVRYETEEVVQYIDWPQRLAKLDR